MPTHRDLVGPLDHLLASGQKTRFDDASIPKAHHYCLFLAGGFPEAVN